MDKQSTLAIGDIIVERYAIKAFIGSGGTGQVYRAFDNDRGEMIAIKVIKTSLISNSRSQQILTTVAADSLKLNHPNIVKRYDIQQEGDNYFLTMELLEGQSLREIMSKRKQEQAIFTIDEVQHIITEISKGLAFIHKYTVHGDIKPENIGLTQQGEYKIMDVGIAAIQSISQRTKAGVTNGTAYYLAPEQLKGQSNIDEKTDQYALAVLAYELLSGQVPTRTVEPIQSLRQDTPKIMANAINKALSLRPENRFYHITDFSAAVANKPPLGLPIKALALAIGIATIIFIFNDNKPSPEPADIVLASTMPTEIEIVTAQHADTLNNEPQQAAKVEAEIIKQAQIKAEIEAKLKASKQAQLKAEAIKQAQINAEAKIEATKRSQLEAEIETAKQAQLEAEIETAKQAQLEAEIETAKQAQLETEIEAAKQAQLAVAQEQQKKIKAQTSQEVALIPLIGKMITIPAGTFQMGCVSGQECWVVEKPIHRVTLPSFKLGQTEVTWAQYQFCINAEACVDNRTKQQREVKQETHPVTNVSYNDITQYYLPWLNAKTGLHFRLPSEAEWEYAARAGSMTRYSWGNTIQCNQAQYNGGENSSCYYKQNGYYRGTASVASYAPNTFGLYDMHGNVWEWTQDCWNTSYKNAPNNGSAWTQGRCQQYVLRGGSWVITPENLRAAYRHRSAVTSQDNATGFRLVLAR